MPINEKMNVTISYIAPRVGRISKRSEDVTIIDTSHNVIVITIDRNWKTSAANSQYGSLYIKPTLNVYDEIMANGGFISGKKYQFIVESDVALIADNINVGAIYGDSRVPANYEIEVELHGLAMGRGGYAADTSIYDVVGNKNKITGGNGGPAITSVRPLKVNVYGGVTGGGGGGGAGGYYWNDDGYYNTGIYEWWLVGPKYPADSGSGAPFGLKVLSGGQLGSMEILTHQNADIMYDLDNAPARLILEADTAYRQKYKSIAYDINVKEEKFTGYVDNNFQTSETVNAPLTSLSRFFVNKMYQNIAESTRLVDYLVVRENQEIIKFDKIGTPGYKDILPTMGAVVPMVGDAGLFRGASAGYFNSNALYNSDWSSGILARDQNYVDSVLDELRGSNGGDVGSNGENGPMPSAFTTHAGLIDNSFQRKSELLEGIHGLLRVPTGGTNYNTYNNIDKVEPITGAVGGTAGPIYSGSVTVEQMDGGAIGGGAVLAKYDPNGNYDLNVRNGKKHGKTFKGRWYTS